MNTHYMNAEEEKRFILSHGGVPVEVHCDTCGGKHYQGKGYYPLQRLSGYGLFCCDSCRIGNWDGWMRGSKGEKRIVEHMITIGKPLPQRNEEGFLPYEFSEE